MSLPPQEIIHFLARSIEHKKTHDRSSSGVGSKNRNWKRLLVAQLAPARAHNRAAATTTTATPLAADLHMPRGYTRIAPNSNDLVSPVSDRLG